MQTWPMTSLEIKVWIQKISIVSIRVIEVSRQRQKLPLISISNVELHPSWRKDVNKPVLITAIFKGSISIGFIKSPWSQFPWQVRDATFDPGHPGMSLSPTHCGSGVSFHDQKSTDGIIRRRLDDNPVRLSRKVYSRRVSTLMVGQINSETDHTSPSRNRTKTVIRSFAWVRSDLVQEKEN